MQQKETILILDFGGQYTQLIARRVRECHVYSEVIPWNTSLADILARNPKGVILSGGPSSVHDEGAPRIDPALYEAGIPVLGICYGMQLTALLLGGSVERAKEREYGRITVAGGGNQHDLLVLFPHGAADGVKTIDNGLQLRGEAPVIDG